MRVLVTGATGFIGSHTVAALDTAGHDVVVLARDPARVPAVLGVHGVSPEVVGGDMTDPVSVRTAVARCDAVIHAAAQVGVGGGGPAGDANVVGTRTVVGAAIDAGVGRIVYTSSFTVHLPCDTPRVGLDSPLVEPDSPYAASKVEAERLVRGWQSEGREVTAVVLGGVYGPLAASLTGSFTAIREALGAMMLVPPGGTTVIDVRDVARVLVAAVGHDTFVPRVLAGGHWVSWQEWVGALGAAAGRPVATLALGAEELLEMAAELESAAPEGEEPALTTEAARVMLRARPLDDEASLQQLGVTLRPLEETFSDTIAYLRSIGELPGAHN